MNISIEQAHRLQNLRSANAMTSNADKFAGIHLFEDGESIVIYGSTITHEVTSVVINGGNDFTEITKDLADALEKRYSR